MHRDLLKSLAFLLAIQTLISAATPAPRPAWSRPRRGAGEFSKGLPTPRDVTDISQQRRAAGVRTQLQRAAQPAAAPGGAGGNGRPAAAAAAATAGSRAKTRRGKRSRRRGSRGGVNWRRHADINGKDLIVGQLNIQSLKPNLPDLVRDIDRVYGFDVYCLSETWLAPNIPDRLITVPGYKVVRCDRANDRRLPKGHGGVAILIRESIPFVNVATPNTGITASNLEIVWTSVTASKRNILIASVYRVPKNTQSQLNADLEDLENQIQHLSAQFPKSSFIVAGDMNCCLLKDGNTAPSRLLRQLLTTYALELTNTTAPTYRPARSLPDIIATSFPESVLRSGVTRCHYGSPHDITRIAVRLRGSVGNCMPVYLSRNLKRIDTDTFTNDLINTDWTSVY